MKMKHLLKQGLVTLSLIAISIGSWGQGLETFSNLSLSGTSYANGTFLGQDGSTWTYVQCRGDYAITDKAIMIGRSRTPQSNFYSGSIEGGIGILNFDYSQAFTTNVNLNVLINDVIVGNVTSSSEQGVIKNSGDITVNVSGNFVIKFINVNNSDGQVVVDNVTWTGYSSGGNQNPVISNISQNPAQLIQSSTTVSVSANVADSDGTVDLVQLRWGKAADELENTINMTFQGGGVYTTASGIPSQYNGTTIYYAVYAEDNDGGSTTSTTQNYMVSPVISLETFDSDLGDFITYSVAGDSRVWGYTSVSGNGVAQMNGYGSDTTEVDWLIMPNLNLSAQDLVLSFETWKRYGVTDENNYLKLYYSTNYPGQGDPTDFTWVELAFTQPEEDQVWASSGLIDLSAIEGENVYIGFEYRYSSEYVQWRVDNVKLEKKTYTVVFDVVDYTNPYSPTPLNNVNVDFYNVEKLTNVEGQTVYTWVENGTNIQFTASREGYHEFIGLLTVDNKDLTQQVRMLNTKAAVNIAANPSANTASITWDGVGAENYAIHYVNNSTQIPTYVTASESPASIVVSPETTYTLKVRALLDGVWTRYSDPIEFTTLAGTPIIASNISVNNITSNSAQVNWIGEGAEAYAVKYYNIETPANFSYVTASASPLTITVMPETTYGVVVRTLVNGQWTPYSPEVEFTTLAGTPVIASNISVTNITSGSAQVNWVGEGADAYALKYYNVATPANFFYVTTSSSPTTITVMPETTYGVVVRTLVNGQWTPYTNEVQFITPAGAQIIATNISVDNITSASARVSWNGEGADAYGILYWDRNSSTQYFITTYSSPTTIALLPSTSYGLRMRTLSNGTWTPYSETIEFESPAGAQMLATNVIVSDITPYSAVVSWDGEGAELYGVSFFEVGSTARTYVTTTASSLPINVEPGKDYNVRVRTLINGAWSRFTDLVPFSTPTEPKSGEVDKTFSNNTLIAPENIMLFPNPATDYTIVRFLLKESTDVTISITDLRGALVKQHKLFNQKGEVDSRIDLTSLSAGMYIVKISTTNHFESRRLIIR
jgi:hypothetical protein